MIFEPTSCDNADELTESKHFGYESYPADHCDFRFLIVITGVKFDRWIFQVALVTLERNRGKFRLKTSNSCSSISK